MANFTENALGTGAISTFALENAQYSGRFHDEMHHFYILIVMFVIMSFIESFFFLKSRKAYGEDWNLSTL